MLCTEKIHPLVVNYKMFAAAIDRHLMDDLAYLFQICHHRSVSSLVITRYAVD